MMSSDTTVSAVDKLTKNLDEALTKLQNVKPFARSTYQTDVFQITEALMGSAAGLRGLYGQAHRFDEAGVFAGGPWEDPGKLQPPLVAGSLKASGVYPVVETLSELRLLSLAKGRSKNEDMSQEAATQFLNEVMALNLEYLFPGNTEEERIEGGPHRESNIRLFKLLAEEMSLESLRDEVIREIEQVCAQRPVSTKRVRTMIRTAARIPRPPLPEGSDRLSLYLRAVDGSTPLAVKYPDVAQYRLAISEADEDALLTESEQFAETMQATGLVCKHHAVLTRLLARKHPNLVGKALGLRERGEAELVQNREFVKKLIKAAIFPSTTQALYGLACALERGLISRQQVQAGIQRLISLDLRSEVRRSLLSRRERRDGVTANSILTAGLLAVLGRPLGVGQGKNPTCQAARAISLWSQHDEGNLLHYLISAARDGVIEMSFEGGTILSDQVQSVIKRRIDNSLDPVSLILVPHLDLIYEEMMRRASGRNEDAHKWVNPALYGRWVSSGFSSIFIDIAQTTVAGYEDFLRRFYATHHPAYNDGHPLMYPNPVGLCVTSSHGDYLGPHAVSIQRVAEAPDGQLRVYFYNPNNEGRQNWGSGIRPSVQGHGEVMGESSLPFAQFASRLYAFHYNPYEEGDSFAVPEEELAQIDEMARASWGRAFLWSEPPLSSLRPV